MYFPAKEARVTVHYATANKLTANVLNINTETLLKSSLLCVKIYSMTTTKPQSRIISFRLFRDTEERLRAYAEQNHLSVNAVVQMALNDYLKERQPDRTERGREE
jgi:predicted HicB family RNase H-like nuclease